MTGKLIKGTHTINEASAENEDPELSYTDRLEQCLISVCMQMDIPVPPWLPKNTREFVRFRRTFFFEEQFIEKVGFDRFEIRQIGSKNS
ncbi:MAG: hypothetical protein PHX37_00115 [Eubacteriales bacterium]|nr:hypothetical protein [Eubacteriales bacterium]